MRKTPLKRKSKKQPAAINRALWDYSVSPKDCVMCQNGSNVPKNLLTSSVQFLLARPHHVIPKQILRREHLEEYLWDVRNKLDLCGYHHPRHECGVERVPKYLLPNKVFVFTKELKLEWVLDRYYA